MRIVIALLSFFISVSVFASPATDLSNLLAQTKTMQAQFKQTVYDENKRPLQTTTGTMALDRPGKFRWAVAAPVAQLIVANNKILFIYDADLAQLTKRSLPKVTGETPALLLTNTETNLTQSYRITTLPASHQHARFKLQPIDKNSVFSDLEIEFALNNLIAMQLNDRLGHATVIQFSAIKRNQPLSNSLFNIKAPPGTDIINAN